jgi:GDPmannose 4,6-dehydratase
MENKSKSQNKKKALIYGVTGQDGSYLSKFLLKKGYEVIGISRNINTLNLINLEKLNIKTQINLVSSNVNNYKSVLQTITKFEPDEIYNLSGQTSVGLSFDMPLETFNSISIGMMNILEVVRLNNKNIRIFNACSADCFGDSNGEVINENSKFSPLSPYAVAKAASYWQVNNYRDIYNIHVSSGIMFNHESPLRSDGFVTKKIIREVQNIKKGLSSKLTLGNLNIARDWGFAGEYVEAMWLMLQQNSPQDYILATGKTHSLRQFVEIAFNNFGLDWEKYIEIDFSLYRKRDILINMANPDKAKSVLGWYTKENLEQLINRLLNNIYE